MRKWWLAAFWAAWSFAMVMALLPKPPAVPGDPPDKLQHIAAFAVLSVLGAKAFADASLVRIGAFLGATGLLIELLQAIPALHRDASIWDWVADVAAIAVVLSLYAAARGAARRSR